MKYQQQVNNKHEFAVHLPSLDDCQNISIGKSITIIERELLHRLHQILRLSDHDVLQLFAQQNWVRGKIVTAQEKKYVINILEHQELLPCLPYIDAAVPLLERSAFEETVAMLSILGIRSIIPYKSDKTKRTALQSSEHHRLQRVMIAAAEQSKQFMLPQIHAVTALSAIDMSRYDARVLFDQHGDAASFVVQKIADFKNLLVICGPEGDLTTHEKHDLKSRGVLGCRLTSAVLRTEHAYTIGVGMLRAFFHHEIGGLP